MQPSDYEKFRDMVAGVYAMYGRDFSPFLMQLWWEALKVFDLQAISRAFSVHVGQGDNGQFLPKPSDISKLIGGSTNDRALQAWAKVDRAVRCVGSYASVAFDDPLIHRVLHEMGGWIGLSQKSENEWPFVAKEFENRYRGYAMRAEVPEYPPVLIGISEAHNTQKGLSIDPPRLIGNAEKANEVMSGGATVELIGLTRATPRLSMIAA